MEGDLNVLDVLQLVGVILGTLEFSNEQFQLGDMNGDDSINVLDVVILVDMILNG